MQPCEIRWQELTAAGKTGFEAWNIVFDEGLIQPEIELCPECGKVYPFDPQDLMGGCPYCGSL